MASRNPPSPPFFGNTRDNLHCFHASMRAVLKNFLPGKNFTWTQLDRMTGSKKELWTWPAKMLPELRKLGLDVQVIDAFDRHAFVQRGGEYLIELWGKEVGEAQIRNSDIPGIRKIYRRYGDDIPWKVRPATVRDIRSYLARGFLVECPVNSAALNGKKGYAGHSVLVYRMTRTHVFLHDPGLPPMPQRRVTLRRFTHAWGKPVQRALTAIGKSPDK